MRELGKATQFGGTRGNLQSQNIPGANKPWSLKQSIRHIGAQPLDIENPAEAMKKLLGKTPSALELQAAKVLIKGINGDMGAIKYCGEQVDGKVANTNINATFTALLGMSDAQLLEIINEPIDGEYITIHGKGSSPSPGRGAIIPDEDAPGEAG